jgi:hypothetical protein
VFLPTYYSTTIHLDLLATGFIISSNDKLQIYLLFIWSRRVVVETIFRKGKNLYVANECNNQRYERHLVNCIVDSEKNMTARETTQATHLRVKTSSLGQCDVLSRVFGCQVMMVWKQEHKEA